MTRLTTAVLFTFCFIAPYLLGAETNESATFRVFSIDSNVSGLFYDSNGEKVRLKASKWLFSKEYPAPTNGTIQIFREGPPIPPSEKPTRIPITEISLGNGGPWLVFLREPHPNDEHSSVVGIAYDNSLENNPPDQIRVFNFCDAKLVAQIEGEPLALPINGNGLTSFPAGKPKVWLKAATYIDDQWKLRISGPERIRENTQTTWVFLTLKAPTRDPQRDQLALRKLYQPLSSQ